VHIFVEFLQTQSIFYLFLIFLIGLAVGSFLNVVIIRLPRMIERDWREECCNLLDVNPENTKQKEQFNLITPSSHCPFCKQKIKIIENIPLLSYLFLKGKCSNCKEKISLRYPIIEFASAVSVCIVAHFFGVSIQAFFAICLTWALIVLSVIDLDTRYLPDDITLPLLWLGIVLNIFNIFTDINSSILGAVFGYGILWIVYFVFKLITGKIGMGHGDFKLLAVFGAWFGWQNLAPIIILSSITAILVATFLIINKSYDKNKGIPFGPYLAFAGWISMILGPYIISVYLNAVM
jgi:leader peptidase (prepilin peptidase)/N-methyltransferase